MKPIQFLFSLAFITLGTMLGCKHDPNPIKQPPAPITEKDLADSVCFSSQIEPLLNSNCSMDGCHDSQSHQAGVIMDSYQKLKATVSGNSILRVIKDTSSLAMPPSYRLTASQISLIEKWVNEGMKDGIDCNLPCDTTSFTYSGTIKTIIDNSCLGCHNPNTGSTMITNYNETKALVDNGKLACVIKQAGGCLAMPPPKKLTDCQIKQIEKWIAAGAPQN